MRHLPVVLRTKQSERLHQITKQIEDLTEEASKIIFNSGLEGFSPNPSLCRLIYSFLKLKGATWKINHLIDANTET